MTLDGLLLCMQHTDSSGGRLGHINCLDLYVSTHKVVVVYGYGKY